MKGVSHCAQLDLTKLEQDPRHLRQDGKDAKDEKVEPRPSPLRPEAQIS